MSLVRRLRSLYTGSEFDPFDVDGLPGPKDRPVEMILDLAALRSDLSWYQPDRRDMWRFGAMLALDPQDSKDAGHIVSLGEGFTPVLRYEDHPTAQHVGFDLGVKDEGIPHRGFGANPTRSFKDRGMSMVVSMARRLGIQKLVIPTQGNAGDALVEYAIAAGLEVAVVVPDDTPLPILGRLAADEKRHPSVTLELVAGTIQEAGEVVREKFIPDGYFNVATFQEPGWRIEGKKTFGLELAEPREPGGAWTVPDVVIYPTGGGTGLLGMWKAFAELEEIGLIGEERPRMVAVQSEATAPVARAFEENREDVERADPGGTIATGLNVSYSIGHRRVLSILRESGGAALSVPDDAIRAWLRKTYTEKGWWMCPEGAACLAAIDPLVEGGIIGEGDRVVAFNTASLEKYLPSVCEQIQDG